jgi:hypothetical protein
MNKTIEQTVVDEASVSRVAYRLWENAGRPAGRDLEFWLAAEAQVRASVKQTNDAGNSQASVAAPFEKPQRATRPARTGAKKSWPKPYPSLPKF